MADNQPTLFDTEVWKPVVGWEEAYEVSNMGRVRGLDRRVPSRGGTRLHRGKILKNLPDEHGYLRVNLSVNGHRKRMGVHRLVLQSFGPKEEGNFECRHLDGNPSNNVLSNLRWGTRTENAGDALIHGTHFNKSKTHCPLGHLLVGENLIKAKANRGERQCRSCSNASAWKSHLKKRNNYEMSDTEFKGLADSYYESRSPDKVTRPA